MEEEKKEEADPDGSCTKKSAGKFKDPPTFSEKEQMTYSLSFVLFLYRGGEEDAL